MAINSFGPVLSIDIETALPRLGGPNGHGWISGPALKPLALRCVRDVARAMDLPVIGVGGVTRGTDVVEMLMAGASAVGVCTAAILRGPSVFGKLAQRARDVARRARVRHCAGAHRDVAHPRLARRPAAPPIIDPEACNGCGVCVTACVYGAIHLVDGRAALDGETCERCGLCVTRCRLDAIHWPEVPA